MYVYLLFIAYVYIHPNGFEASTAKNKTPKIFIELIVYPSLFYDAQANIHACQHTDTDTDREIETCFIQKLIESV